MMRIRAAVLMLSCRHSESFASVDTISHPTRLFSSERQSVITVARESYNKLVARNVPEPEESVIHLLAKAMDLPWETGYRDIREILHSPIVSKNFLSNASVSDTQVRHFNDLLERRTTLEPIQYLVGQWDFLDSTFLVKPPLLCPRPETEELVEHVCRDLVSTSESTPTRPLRVLDIGCGTGCIGISIARRLDACQVEAIDIEPAAVEVSSENALQILGHAALPEKYSVSISSASEYKPHKEGELFHLVVSNPPYIPLCDMASLSKTVQNFESNTALCGGAEGLDVIEDIIELLPSICAPGASCWLEVDPTHPEMIESRLHKNSLVNYVESYEDLMGNPRFVQLRVSY